MPERFVEHYGGGTWFKAAFLHTFTFLALSFLLVNPPFGDIAAPELASKWTVVADDGEELVYPHSMATSGATLTWHTDGSPILVGEAWLLFGLMDNVNSDGRLSKSRVNIRRTKQFRKTTFRIGTATLSESQTVPQHPTNPHQT